jgi:hypothetical protein
MTRVVGAWPMNLLDLWYPFAVEVVAEKGDFEVEVVGAGGGECDCAVVMAVVEVVYLGFGCATELHALAGGGFQCCISSLRVSLALC